MLRSAPVSGHEGLVQHVLDPGVEHLTRIKSELAVGLSPGKPEDDRVEVDWRMHATALSEFRFFPKCLGFFNSLCKSLRNLCNVRCVGASPWFGASARNCYGNSRNLAA